MADCSIIDCLGEAFPDTLSSSEQQIALLAVMVAACAPPPSSAKIVDPMKDIKWNLNKKDAKDTQAFMTKHCADLVNYGDEKDRALLDVLAVGRKNGIHSIFAFSHKTRKHEFVQTFLC